MPLLRHSGGPGGLGGRWSAVARDRRLPEGAVELMRGTGSFRIGVRKKRGGPEPLSAERTEAIAALSYGGSAADCAQPGRGGWRLVGWGVAPSVGRLAGIGSK
ncbi:hypothetical protein BU197_18180 [Streptomyces sp. CBMA291]|nr:hypothetical protein [Streptomyces sp. CBMA291]MBD0715763.1 hypothetical protein [Streptomyces sp. CBMA370]